MSTHLDWLQEEIQALKDAGFYNNIRTISSPQGAWLAIDGRHVSEFLLEQLPGSGQPSPAGGSSQEGNRPIWRWTRGGAGHFGHERSAY